MKFLKRKFMFSHQQHGVGFQHCCCYLPQQSWKFQCRACWMYNNASWFMIHHFWKLSQPIQFSCYSSLISLCAGCGCVGCESQAEFKYSIKYFVNCDCKYLAGYTRFPKSNKTTLGISLSKSSCKTHLMNNWQ